MAATNRMDALRRFSARGRLAVRAAMVMAVGAVLIGSGCQSGSPAASPATRPASGTEAVKATEPANEFADLVRPADFDEGRASMALAAIPDGPDVPASETAYEPPQLPRQAIRRMEEARRLFAEHRFTETIRELEQALRYNANNSEAHRMMAVACLLSGDDTRAKHSAAKAIELEPDDLVSHYVLGRLAEKDDRRQAAIRIYRAALKCSPSPASETYRDLIHYYLGNLLYEEGYYAAAAEQLASFEEGLRGLDETADGNPELETLMNTRRGRAAMLQGRAHGLLGAYAQAAEALQRAAEASPRDLDLRAEAIRMLVRAGREREAAKEAAELVTDSAGSKEAVRLLLAVHRHMGQPQRGLEAIRGILEAHPERVELWLVYADGLIASGRMEQAAVALEDLLAQHPDLEEPRWKLIALQRQRGQWAEWLNALARELAREPKNTPRATAELLSLSTGTRSRIVEQASSRSPDATWFAALPSGSLPRAAQLYLLGRLCDLLDRTEEAERYFEKSLAQDGEYYPAAIGTASMYIRRARWQDGIDAAEQALEMLDAPSHELERVLAQCYDGLDQLDKAMKHYRDALEIAPEDTTTLYLFGKFYERQGDLRDAKTQYEKAIDVDRQDLRAREALVRILIHESNANPFQADRLKRQVLQQVQEMHRLAPEAPATMRCLAMISPRENMQQYMDALKALIERWPDETLTYEDLARAYLETRRFEEAREALTALLERDPYDAEAHYILAETYLNLLAYDQADAQYERMREIHPNRETWLSEHGDLLMLLPAYDRAIETYTHLLQQAISPSHVAAYRSELMEAFRRVGRFDLARERATAWLEDAESTQVPLYRWFLLAADLEEGRIDSYLQRCTRWLEEEPEDVQIRGWYLGVRDYVTVGDRDEPAPGIFDIGLILPRLNFAESCGQIGAEHWDAAVTLALRWHADDPEDLRYAHWLLETLMAAQRYEEAAEWGRYLLKSAEGYKDRLTAMEYLRSIYLHEKEYEAAITTVKDMLAEARKAGENERNRRDAFLLNAYWAQWQRALAGIYTQAKQYDQAVTYLQRLLDEADEMEMETWQRDRYKADILRWLAFTYQEQDRIEDAEQHLRVALKLRPSDAGLNNDLGYTLANAGLKLAEAEKMIRLAVSLMREEPAYMDSLGWVLYKKGDFDGALEWLKRATSMPGGRDAVIFDHLGDTYWRLQQADKAVAQWEKAMELQKEKVQSGEAMPDPGFTERVQAKIGAAGDGGEPEVAAYGEKAVPSTQPTGNESP